MSAIIVNGLYNALKGAIVGTIASAVGYAKQEEIGNWQFDKMLKTIIVGAITVSIISGSGLSIVALADLICTQLLIPAGVTVTASLVEGAILTGIVIVADEIVKIIARRTPAGKYFDKLKDLLGKFSIAMGNRLVVKPAEPVK